MTIQQIQNVFSYFQNVHTMDDNNLIIGDFNFADKVVDKGKGMDIRDRMINPHWEEFKSKTDIIDPYRMQYPRKKSTLS